ncbi:MAG TPA: S8 family serine peptidase [Gemmataceae bacterium]|jgi:subtilisin family serine protease|nr:S8 family serine peptidase [Gemmataceae bacterium]
MKVAILDSGFRGYRAHLGKALPDRVLVQSFRADGNLEAKDSQHGILCGEVVHALAPEANLLFANWDPDKPEQFLQAARWAREQGAHLISCSVIMPSWSDGEGGGATHVALSRILGDGSHPGDVLCFASAGNTARRHWSGSFMAAADGFHQWRPGLTGNVMTPWGSERASAELYWPSGADYDLFVYDRDTGEEVGRSLAQPGTARCSAVVHVEPKAGHAYQVRVRLARGPAGRFHFTALNADLDYGTNPGSVSFPADGAEVIAMGAVDSQGVRQSYSACGPNSTKPKPDFVAPVPFASSWRTRPFSGTSAAAPEAAAVAALLWSRYPDWHADKIRAALYAAAHDLGAPGHDWETGYGLIELPKLDRVALP